MSSCFFNSKTAKHLVVDANAFLKNAKLENIGEHIYTIKDVVNEIKDKPTRQRLQVLPYELLFRVPASEDLTFVSDFSKKTGDYRSLSATDIKLIAVAYRLHCEFVGCDDLKKEPVISMTTYSTTNQFTQNPTEIAGFYLPKKSCLPDNCSSDDSECGGDDTLILPSNINHIPVGSESSDLSNTIPVVVDSSIASDLRSLQMTDESKRLFDQDSSQSDSQPPTEEEGVEGGVIIAKEATMIDENELGSDDDGGDEGEESDSGGGGGWITEDNFNDALHRMGGDMTTGCVDVACLTTDFAVQNVLLHLGLNVISVDGMLIKKLKNYVLRCRACYKTTSLMTKQFCGACGNATLDKVSVTVDENGAMHYHLSRRKPLTTRGLKYSLPAPKGGKHANNPILFEDQPMPENRLSRKALQKIDVFDDDYTTRASPFVENDVCSRSAKLAVRRINKNPVRHNPNAWQKNKKRGGKKH